MRPACSAHGRFSERRGSVVHINSSSVKNCAASLRCRRRHEALTCGSSDAICVRERPYHKRLHTTGVSLRHSTLPPRKGGRPMTGGMGRRATLIGAPSGTIQLDVLVSYLPKDCRWKYSCSPSKRRSMASAWVTALSLGGYTHERKPLSSLLASLRSAASNCRHSDQLAMNLLEVSTGWSMCAVVEETLTSSTPIRAAYAVNVLTGGIFVTRSYLCPRPPVWSS